jgi:hypothetical protein
MPRRSGEAGHRGPYCERPRVGAEPDRGASVRRVKPRDVVHVAREIRPAGAGHAGCRDQPADHYGLAVLRQSAGSDAGSRRKQEERRSRPA